MIKSKEPQLIDAQNQISSTVFMDMGPAVHDRKNGFRKFNITTYVEVQNEQGETVLHGIKENIAVFKESTFLSIWGGLTFAEFESQVDQFLIDQIDYINKYTWTGNEAQPMVRFWNLTSEGLEIVL